MASAASVKNIRSAPGAKLSPPATPASVSRAAPAAAPSRTASEDIAKASGNVVTVKDDLGRTLSVKKLLPSEKMRLMSLIGGENAKNEMYMGYAVLAASVQEIDGEIEEPLNTRRELENLVDRLGDEGLAAVGQAHAENFMTEAQLAALLANAKN